MGPNAVAGVVREWDLAPLPKQLVVLQQPDSFCVVLMPFLSDIEYCSSWKMIHLCREASYVTARKGGRPIGCVNYLTGCRELFALFPYLVNKFLRYSRDQSELTAFV